LAGRRRAEKLPKTTLQPFGWAVIGRLSAEIASQLAGQETASPSVPKRQRAETAVEHTVETASPLPDEETWEEAYVSYNAGGGGVLKATAKEGKKRAELRGVEKARRATDPSLHKKLFEKPKNIPRTIVTVRKIGNNYEILSVMPMNLLEKTQDKP